MNNSFVEGIGHILDLQGYDHMLFLLVLIVGYTWMDWKKILWLVTAFTIGHATTLLCAGMGWLRFNRDLIEFLISLTIFITALLRIIQPSLTKVLDWKNYILIFSFGLIHGMGFSSFFRMMYNETSDMVMHLLLFNLGVETGQIIAVTIILLIFSLIFHFVRIKREILTRLVLAASLLLSGIWVYQKSSVILDF